MSCKKLVIGAIASLSIAASTQVQANVVSWGVNAAFGNGTTISGTVSFDDATVQGFYDGIADPSDTHVYGDFTLTSTALGWLNTVFSAVQFQPYFYVDQGDGPHVDQYLADSNVYVLLDNFNSASILDGNFISVANGSWSFDRNGGTVPVPATLPLLGLGLAMLACTRRQKSKR